MYTPEITLGLIGDELIEPVIIWNDTLREGPRDVKYFGLTTDQSSATFGVNCDVPNLHFPDTCVTDEDCEEFPNTVCKNVPVNKGLDPGTRNVPFKDWEPRDTLLKSCFCRAGHVRIPQSKGCYDPIRRVITLRYVSLLKGLFSFKSLLPNRTQFGNHRIFLSLRFYVKSKLVILEVQQLPF